MYFYLIFGGLLVLPVTKRIFALSAVLLAIFIGANLGPEGSVFARFYGYSVIFEFLAGVVIARFYLAGRLLPQSLAKPLALIAFAVMLIADYQNWDGPRAVMAGLPAAVVILALVSLDFSKVRELRGLHYLGDASYSLYITHVFVLAGMRIAYGLAPYAWLKNEFVFLAACICASMGFAVLVYRFYEKPVSGYLKKLRKHRRSQAGYLSSGETV